MGSDLGGRRAFAVPRTDFGHVFAGLVDAADSDRRSEFLGDAGENADVGERIGFVEDRIEGTHASFPVDEGAGLFDNRGDREDHVRHRGDGAFADFEAQDEAGCLECGTCLSGIGKVIEFDATNDEGLDGALPRTLQRCGEDARSVAALLGHYRLDAPRGGEIGARARIGERTCSGEQCRQATGFDRTAVPCTARNPREPGLGGRRCLEGGTESTRYGGQTLPGEDDRVLVEVEGGQGSRFAARRDLDEFAAHFGEAAGRMRGDGADLDAAARCLAQA